MPELTETRKAEIALEEIYRAQIQPIKKSGTLVADADSVGRRILKFFNSNLGIWLLSSVVLSSMATFLQREHAKYIDKAANRLRIESTKFNVSDRVEELRFFLRNADTNAECTKALETLFRTGYPNPGPTGGSSIYSLVYAIYPLLANPHDKVIKDALETIRKMEHKYIELKGLEAGVSPPANTKETLYAQLDHLQSLQLVPAKLKD
jgi:hypothetical protein